MAVSGRKLSDFRDSNSHGSEEDHDTPCDPCLTTDKRIGAHRYCVDCGEYLCKNCSDCHLKTKASRNHQLIYKDNIGKNPTSKNTEVCTAECTEHKQEQIIYYCPRHEAFGCHDCIILNHRTCDIEYIPDKCSCIADSEEYRQTMQDLDHKLQELDDITKAAHVRTRDIDACHKNLITKIIKFRKKLNDRLDQLQSKIHNEAEKKRTADKQTIQRILDACSGLSSDIKRLQSSLQATKSSRQNEQLYITVKQAQSILKTDEIKAAEDGFERTRMRHKFDPNSSLRKMLTNQDILGKLSLTIALDTPRKKQAIHQLTYTGDINVRTKSDKTDCWITGCAVLSRDTLALADYMNKKLKVVNTRSKTVVEEMSLDSTPWDIAVLPQDQIAVTMPDKREVLIMTTARKLSTVRKIPVKGGCRGVTYHQNNLYVVCAYPVCVVILDTQGNEENEISLTSENISRPRYLVLSDDSKLIYISDSGKNCVVSITLQGEVTAVYKHKDLSAPLGMLVLDDGSLLVCSWNGIIQHISGGLKQGRTTIGGVQDAYSICYNHFSNEIYIGSNLCDQMKVFSPRVNIPQ